MKIKSIAKTRKYLLSYFKDDPESPEDIQDLILRVLRHDGYGTGSISGDRLDDGYLWVFNKSKLFEYLKQVFLRFRKVRNGGLKNQSDGQILRQLNNLIKQKALEVKNYKRVNVIVRGEMFNIRISRVQKMITESSSDTLITKILMGDDSGKRMRYIKENGHQAEIDV